MYLDLAYNSECEQLFIFLKVQSRLPLFGEFSWVKPFISIGIHTMWNFMQGQKNVFTTLTNRKLHGLKLLTLLRMDLCCMQNFVEISAP